MPGAEPSPAMKGCLASPRGKYRNANWNSVQPSFIYVWNRSLRTLFPVPFPLCSASPLRASCPRANLCVIHTSRLNDERRLVLPRATKTSPGSRKVTDAPSIITGLTLKNVSQTRERAACGSINILTRRRNTFLLLWRNREKYNLPNVKI